MGLEAHGGRQDKVKASAWQTRRIPETAVSGMVAREELVPVKKI
jgi:hypothetical protein